MTLEDSIQGIGLRVTRRSHELGSVSAACREVGISRTLFYRWRKRFERYGPDGVHPRRQQARRGRPSPLSPQVEQLVIGLALGWGTWGAARLAAHLARQHGVRVAPSTIQRLLRRGGLATRRARLVVIEHQSLRQVGLLTERTRQQLLRTRHEATRHVEAHRPRELVCLDTFYIGSLKGVGKVWQITACDAASSYGLACWLLPTLSAQAAAAFLERIVLPHYRRAGWRVQRVLTDGGPEFHGVFDEACRRLGIQHTRTKPRHAWTNGFVERLQGTILQEHWRVQFRRRYFTSRAALAQTLADFMRFYNEQRPHHGYRLGGRTPAAVFHGAVRAAH